MITLFEINERQFASLYKLLTPEEKMNIAKYINVEDHIQDPSVLRNFQQMAPSTAKSINKLLR